MAGGATGVRQAIKLLFTAETALMAGIVAVSAGMVCKSDIVINVLFS